MDMLDKKVKNKFAEFFESFNNLIHGLKIPE